MTHPAVLPLEDLHPAVLLTEEDRHQAALLREAHQVVLRIEENHHQAAPKLLRQVLLTMDLHLAALRTGEDHQAAPPRHLQALLTLLPAEEDLQVALPRDHHPRAVLQLEEDLLLAALCTVLPQAVHPVLLPRVALRPEEGHHRAAPKLLRQALIMMVPHPAAHLIEEDHQAALPLLPAHLHSHARAGWAEETER